MRQLNRTYNLEIESDGFVKEINALRINFVVKKSSVGSWNTAVVKLYNSNNDTLSMLTRKAKIRLYVGYGGINSLIFSGTVMNAFNSAKGVLEAYASDGEQESKESQISKTYDGSIGIVDIIKDVVSSMPDIVMGDILGIDNDKNDVLGGTYVGEAGQVLDRMAAAMGFDWSIDDGVVTVSKDGSPTNNDIIEVNAATGMISSPTVWHQGVEVNMLLNPLLVPNNRFEVTSSYASLTMNELEYAKYDRTTGNGIYTAVAVTHTGDTHDKDWATFARGIDNG